MTGTPKFFRVSFDFANATGDNIISSGSNSTISGYANSSTDAADSGSATTMYAGIGANRIVLPEVQYEYYKLFLRCEIAFVAQITIVLVGFS